MATYKVFFTNAGVPATGLSPTIPVLKRVDTQDDVTAPTVYEIGGGWYTFEHEPAQAQVGYVDGTATLANADRYIPVDLSPEDVYLDAPVAVIDTVVDAILVDTGTDGVVVNAAGLATDAVTEITNAVKAIVIESQGSITMQQALSIMLSAVAGVTADAGATLKSPNGVATRIAATVNASNERTAITLTPSA